MKSIAVLGSGFGAYVYLPAICQSQIYETTHCVSSLYRFVLSRSDLSIYLENLRVEKSQRSAIALSDDLIYARRPIDQRAFIEGELENYNVENLFLEKPLGNDPDASIACHMHLVSLKQKYHINYSILQLPIWRFSNNSGEYSISWSFQAHHIRFKDRKSWKHLPNQGGGCLRFYGIHLIAVAARFDFLKVISSQTNKSHTIWRCTLERVCGQRLSIRLNIDKAQEAFIFASEDVVLFKAKSPFHHDEDTLALGSERKEDIRIPLTKTYLQESVAEKESNDLSLRVLELWKEIEAQTLTV